MTIIVSTPRSSLRETLRLSLLAAVVVSIIDAVLIQISKELFTGGFLADDTITTGADRIAFAVGSLLSDWALTTPIVVAALAVGRRVRLATPARVVLALGAAILPCALVVVFQYELARYLGDAFDLGLMFDLVGRRPSELLAVAAAHLVGPAALAAAACAGLVAATWLAHRLARRRGGTGPAAGEGPSWRRSLALVAMLVCVALVATGVMRTSSEALDNGLRRKPSNQLIGSIVERITDVDRDGYGLLTRPADPDPWDARVYPYALDIPGNGLDEDGIGGDLPKADSFLLPAAGTPTFATRPDLVVVMLETFRADARGASVRGTPVTPVLDALAARGLSSTRAYSHNGYTVQSRYHLFAGRLAIAPGPTLIDDFKANGYDVAYFSAQDESFGADEYDPGFARADVFYDARQDRDRRYSTFSTPGSLGVTASTLLARIGTFLDGRQRDRPLFLYVNFYDTHYPYHHREMKPLVSDVRLREADIGPGNVARVREGYLNAAAHVDAAIGSLVARLTAHLGHEPALVVLADHGESLFEEGFLGHGHALNDVQTRIPLVIVNLATEVPDPVGQADLRGMIHRALSDGEGDVPASPLRPTGTAGRVAAVVPRQTPLFQYLGKIHRPKQIAFVLDRGRLIYDFRAGRVHLPDGTSKDQASLSADERARFLELIQTWERLRLAETQG